MENKDKNKVTPPRLLWLLYCLTHGGKDINKLKSMIQNGLSSRNSNTFYCGDGRSNCAIQQCDLINTKMIMYSFMYDIYFHLYSSKKSGCRMFYEQVLIAIEEFEIELLPGPK